MPNNIYKYSIEDIIIVNEEDNIDDILVNLPENTLSLTKEDIQEFLLSYPDSVVAHIFKRIESPQKYDEEIINILKKHISSDSFYALGETFVSQKENISIIDSFIEAYTHVYDDLPLMLNSNTHYDTYINLEKNNQLPLLNLLLKNPLYEKGFYDVLSLNINEHEISSMMFKDFKLLLKSLIIAKDEVMMRLQLPESTISNEPKNIHKF